MYRPKAYAVDDVEALHAFIRGRPFATIGVVVESRVVLAYAPVVLDASGALGAVRFHLAKSNPVAAIADGTPMQISFTGPDAYVSPDWYVSQGLVPTWNYMAVEGEGWVRALPEADLRALLVDLSAAQERQLLPKKPWTVDKLSADRLAALTNAVVGFSVVFEKLEGKFKLSQDKSQEDRSGVIAGLEARGDPASLSVAAAMRKWGR
ncbi:MAG: FMN-binding negative transcriptional regulator [Alphaproteobacteria bacterium]|nr:FMN-binding negative transcriptional regulator [Alphaproteobacteria bacterium]